MSSSSQPAEFYEAWTEGPTLPSGLLLEGLHDDFEGFRLLLRTKDATEPIVRVRFRDRFAYRTINESDRLRTWFHHPEITRSLVYEVRNSDWLQWLNAESSETMPLSELKHFAIYSLEECVDVVSASEPEIDLLG